jgi:sortase A
MPGQSRLVYVAGHRTTFLAPFAQINEIQPGDRITLEMPYGAFVYRAFRHVIVPADDLAVLRSPRHELLALQACHPRFFASHRYIVYAHLVADEPRHGRPLRPSLLAAAVSGGTHR